MIHQMRGVGAWMNLTTRDYEAKCVCGDVYSATDHDEAVSLLSAHLRARLSADTTEVP